MPSQKLEEYSGSKAPSVHTSDDEEGEDEKDMEGETLKVCIVCYKFQLICKHTSLYAGIICRLRSVCSALFINFSG